MKGAGLARSCTNPGSPSETWPHGHFIQIGFLLEGKQTFYSSQKRAACQYGYLAGVPVATISLRTMLPHLSFVSAPSAFRFFFITEMSNECSKRNFGADLPWNTNALKISTGGSLQRLFFWCSGPYFHSLTAFYLRISNPPPPPPLARRQGMCYIKTSIFWNVPLYVDLTNECAFCKCAATGCTCQGSQLWTTISFFFFLLMAE